MTAARLNRGWARAAERPATEDRIEFLLGALEASHHVIVYDRPTRTRPCPLATPCLRLRVRDQETSS